MGLRPIFDLGMRLGEGSGCVLAFNVIEAACAVMNDMATFEEAGIDDGYLDEIRGKDSFTVNVKKGS
jgi:nicotinate-nucleotide--dimethylbenzimidazole phosphoribosyltransferase